LKIRLLNLSKQFHSKDRQTNAVNGMNLEIRDGEFFVLLGPSGCGKSTLLNLIAGLEKPTGGEIHFDDRTAVSFEKNIFLPPKERNVSMVFQSYALYPHLNVFENIAFPLKMERAKKASIQEAVKTAAETLAISDLLLAKPGELSGGQRQRVAIARAIVRRPSLFLLDEPLSNLDAQLRLAMREELKDLQQRIGITTVYVTHDQVEAMALGDRIAVLKDGLPQQIGTPDELYERPKTPFVGKFIGTPSMNFLEGRLSFEDGKFRMRIDDHLMIVPDDPTGVFKKAELGPCCFGIRPEHIALSRTPVEHALKGKVHLVESLGKEKVIRVDWRGKEILITAHETDFKAGEDVFIKPNLTKIHIFKS